MTETLKTTAESGLHYEGIIYKALSGFYYVKSSVSRAAQSVVKTVRCVARGRFRYDNSSPLVGDRVVFTETEHGKGIITDILPRKNVFIRPALANIDKMIIVASIAIPATDPFLIDKMTVIALKSACTPVICINKLDINAADDLLRIYKTTGFSVVRTSAVTGAGIDVLVSEIRGCVCGLCGNSGVGKSSILNAMDESFGIRTGDVSRKLGRGRHTTRHIELFELSCGTLIADTPGFSAYDAGFIVEKEELQHLFPEFTPFLGNCRFDNCAHINEPGCAVIGEIHPSRHESYKRLFNQASEYKPWK